MKQLKFDHKYTKAIVEGKKSSTIRIDDKRIVVNDRLQLVDKTDKDVPQEWSIPGEIVVEGVKEYMLGKFPLKELEIEGAKVESKTELVSFLRRFYGESINDDTVVKIINFKFEKYDSPLDFINKLTAPKGEILDKVKLFADGGSRGNPGPSSLGFVILNQDEEVIESYNKYLGITTNNQAEYHAFIAGLEWCRKHSVNKVDVYLDSLLVVNQMNGKFKVKNRDLWSLYETAKKLEEQFVKISFTHVPREMNKLADAEVNKALDAVKGEELIQ